VRVGFRVSCEFPEHFFAPGTQLPDNPPPPARITNLPTTAAPYPDQVVYVRGVRDFLDGQTVRALQLLQMRGPVVIEDEFRTSQHCLCGRVLVDDTNQQATTTGRPRRHTTDADNQACFAMRSFRDKNLVFGRDCISACSIACCAAAGLRFEGATRPAHFCSDRSMNAWRKNTI